MPSNSLKNQINKQLDQQNRALEAPTLPYFVYFSVAERNATSEIS